MFAFVYNKLLHWFQLFSTVTFPVLNLHIKLILYHVLVVLNNWQHHMNIHHIHIHETKHTDGKRNIKITDHSEVEEWKHPDKKAASY